MNEKAELRSPRPDDWTWPYGGPVSAHEAIAYLQSQIDPHDRLNPKYATLQRQIDALRASLADTAALNMPSIALQVPTEGKP